MKFRLTIRDLLWLTVLLTAGSLAAQEPGPTLKELLADANNEISSRNARSRMYRHAKSTIVVSYHDGTRHVTDYILQITWFQDKKANNSLNYQVSDGGQCFDESEVVYGWRGAQRGMNHKHLPPDELNALREQLTDLPESKAEPPIERTVLVSFQSGDKWRTETYDVTKLPDEFEKVMQIIGERFETKDRHKKKD